MPKNYFDKHQDTDRSFQKQKALARNRCLKNLKKPELELDDELFFEKFKAAMHYLWVG